MFGEIQICLIKLYLRNWFADYLKNKINWGNFQYTLLDVQAHAVNDKESIKPQHMCSVKVQQIDNAPKKESNKADTQKLMKSQGFLIKL